MDQTHTGKNSMNMSTLHNNLPTMEELYFLQAVQCTTCLNTGHSTIECSLHTHCTICHSKAHSFEQCEYNLINKATPPVRQIHPKTSYQDNQNTSNNRSYQNNRYEDRYHSDRRDDRRNDNDHGRDDYGRNDHYDSRRDDDCHNYDCEYSPQRENGHIQLYKGGDKMLIAKEIDDSMITRSRKGLDNFNMNLEKGIHQILRILARNMVEPMVLRYRTATYAEKTVIMQINVPQKKKEKHQP